jgi:molybdenum cofactor biosynthesis protein A
MRTPSRDREKSCAGNNFLVDRWNRRIEYLRLAVTDRCNLRCSYCMPSEGISFLPRRELLSFEEIIRLAEIFLRQGISKIRITGGEPFVRGDLPRLTATLKTLPGLQHLHITTNGVSAAPYLAQLREIGISGINLSLDTLRSGCFNRLAGRNFLPKVLATFRRALELGIPLKINTVVQQENRGELLEIAGLAQDHPVEVRFIEAMPFNGGRAFSEQQTDQGSIREILRQGLPPMTRLLEATGTAALYEIQGFRGRVGIIAAHSRKFCDRCNKVRLTPAGSLKTCLYAPPVLDLKAMLRSGCSDEQIGAAVRASIMDRPRNGLEAAETWQGRCHADSMASIGG